mgnify:CR=1 FL=1
MSKSRNEIKITIIKFLKKGNPIIAKLKKIPEDRSLVQLGYIDSFGLIELIQFIENKFKIKIKDSEITPEVFGSLEKMTKLIFKKIK